MNQNHLKQNILIVISIGIIIGLIIGFKSNLEENIKIEEMRMKLDVYNIIQKNLTYNKKRVIISLAIAEQVKVTIV